MPTYEIRYLTEYSLFLVYYDPLWGRMTDFFKLKQPLLAHFQDEVVYSCFGVNASVSVFGARHDMHDQQRIRTAENRR